jgi:hypothetical protein
MVAASSRATVLKSVLGAVAVASLLTVAAVRQARHLRGTVHG